MEVLIEMKYWGGRGRGAGVVEGVGGRGSGNLGRAGEVGKGAGEGGTNDPL